MSRAPTLLEMRKQAELMRDEAAAAGAATAIKWGLAELSPAQLRRWADAVQREADRLAANPEECRRRDAAANRRHVEEYGDL